MTITTIHRNRSMRLLTLTCLAFALVAALAPLALAYPPNPC